MAASFTIDPQPSGYTSAAALRMTNGTVNLGSYATAGMAVTPQMFGLDGVIIALILSPTSGYVFAWDKANSKILAYRNKDPGAAGGADIPMPEVANAVDLSAVNIPVIAFGR
jgi:hypothetical protein